MAVINNIANTKINSLFTSATLNVSDSVNLSPEAFAKDVAGATPIGDFVVNASVGTNVYIDPDNIDQLARTPFFNL